MRKKIWECTVEILNETGNEAVMTGDCALLHMISNRAGKKSNAWQTEENILNALSRCPGRLIRKQTLRGDNRTVRIFRLPEAL